ncbi:MAG: quinolinate synthase [Candidatus Uhrbacteria bacterium]|nr:quinolinate synthase [Candidatus Uhrbacteria bacterium]
MNAVDLARQYHDNFSRFASDLYPGVYTLDRCRELAELAIQIRARAAEKHSFIAAHNYLPPEFHELADLVGDSLELSREVDRRKAPRVDFQSVFFMGATAKIISGDKTRVFVPDTPDALGCSLVFGTNHAWIEKWKRLHPNGVVITYINSDAYLKSISDYICTSGNTDRVIAVAAKEHPTSQILVCPDKFLGYVMRTKAANQFGVDPKRVDVYMESFNGFHACCYVHEKIGEHVIENAMDDDPDAELIIHPECGCANSCLMKLNAGVIPKERAYFLSTSQMLERARVSPAKRFLIATESGMIYRLRKAMPEKEFVPVSDQAVCKFMKANSFEKLLVSLEQDRIEIVLCDDCCDPRNPISNEREVHIQKSIAAQAKLGINRMLAI